MKKIVITSLLIVVVIFLGKTYISGQVEKSRLASVEKGWHVEVTNSYINIRQEPYAYAELLGEVYKGEKYEVLDVNLDSSIFIWYKIKINNFKEGWIASHRVNPYLVDNNNPNDVATPVLKFFDDVYYVDSIEDINYDHLDIWDDKDDFTVTHKVYKEITKDNEIQYWINYTVKDKIGKETSKMQRIIFANNPSNNKVLDFEDFEK